ncbi:hypothetical protein I7I50_11394 [Histoplasma capsulatum G186AR]|uniref:Uncharacterized protein n=1 Tax=Ajellomyces capsulatus TaxID=5037 RepID=A0A8H7Z7T5_AJECA|nr:hypothetical protein I7I52_02632 [Histoplasma capsulatum]QSS69939.1 hypothetical protein I7I50_11394 [Histoplasma capsulatum G186AR]
MHIKQLTLHLFNVICRDTLRLAPLLNIRPPIPTIPVHKHKSIPFRHAPLRVTARFVVVQRNYILQLLRSALGCHCRTTSFARNAVG